MSCDLLTKCRTCLCESHIFHKIYDCVDENYKILEMLNGIVPQIDIKISSNYSSLVCQSCVDKLVASYKFQQLCIETNKRLNDLMGFSIFETASLTGESSFKMEIEVEDDARFECGKNPKELEESSDNVSDWVPDHNTDNDTDSSDNSEKNAFNKPGAKHIKNKDFIDTGIREIEKPSNRRSGNFPCEVCGKVFDRPFSLKRHSAVHSISKPHECKICTYRFDSLNFLKAHMVQHDRILTQSRPEGFKCRDCPRRFEKQASLSAHRQIHTRNAAEANYPCMVCQRKFMSVKSLTAHITNKHPEVEKHKCDQCVKTFVLFDHLMEHLNRHKSNKPIVCLICEKEFGNKYTLKDHMLTHSGEKPYLCRQCGKTFRSASNLRQHMKRHTSFKKYRCPECPSRFNCRSDLKQHKSTHTYAKPHVCDVCGSGFTRAASLKKHKLLHTGEWDFKCNQCSMSFTIIDHLRRHMRTHTGQKHIIIADKNHHLTIGIPNASGGSP